MGLFVVVYNRVTNNQLYLGQDMGEAVRICDRNRALFDIKVVDLIGGDKKFAPPVSIKERRVKG